MLSIRLTHAIRLSPERNWRIAARSGLHSTTLSRWLNGVETPRPDDARLLILGDLMGVPGDELLAPDNAPGTGPGDHGDGRRRDSSTVAS